MLEIVQKKNYALSNYDIIQDNILNYNARV